MKNIAFNRISVITLIVLFCSSCTTLRPVEMEEMYYGTGYDFTEYTQMGFLFTPEGYIGEYESIGVININHVPRFIQTTQRVRLDGFRLFRDPAGEGYWGVSEPDTDRMIKEAHRIASEMGADAIINFLIVPDRFENVNLTVPTVVLTGFAIKRQ